MTKECTSVGLWDLDIGLLFKSLNANALKRGTHSKWTLIFNHTYKVHTYIPIPKLWKYSLPFNAYIPSTENLGRCLMSWQSQTGVSSKKWGPPQGLVTGVVTLISFWPTWLCQWLIMVVLYNQTWNLIKSSNRIMKLNFSPF